MMIYDTFFLFFSLVFLEKTNTGSFFLVFEWCMDMAFCLSFVMGVHHAYTHLGVGLDAEEAVV